MAYILSETKGNKRASVTYYVSKIEVVNNTVRAWLSVLRENAQEFTEKTIKQIGKDLYSETNCHAEFSISDLVFEVNTYWGYGSRYKAIKI